METIAVFTFLKIRHSDEANMNWEIVTHLFVNESHFSATMEIIAKNIPSHEILAKSSQGLLRIARRLCVVLIISTIIS